MTYICATKNTQAIIDAMNGYAGTTLVHTETTFLVWIWINPDQQELSSAPLISMASVHLT